MEVLSKFLLKSFRESTTYALLEDSKSSAEKSNSLLFCNPHEEILAYKLSELPSALSRIESLKDQGFYLCGYLSYEAGYFFIDKFSDTKIKSKAQKNNNKKEPLLYFIAFKDLHHPTRQQLNELFKQSEAFPESDLCIHDFKLNVTKQKYLNIIAKIKKYIEAGDTYQINYTIKYRFKLKGDSVLLYKALRKTQPVEFGALLNFSESKIVSLSPELFVYKNKLTLTSKPMKGTAKRGKTKAEDNRIVSFLKKDPKTLSENVMIVDLIRNDFGIICKIGSVKVKNLFQVQTFKSIHQMISTVKGKLLNDLSFAEILSALFPCGSITGAPKIRTMEIINELEEETRGIYTGAIGYLLPNNDFYFNVPIRTVVINEDEPNSNSNNDKHCEMGIGSGIIYESDAEDEFSECLLKANFLKSINNHFYLIEAIRFQAQKQKLINFDNHLQRLLNSANYFGFEAAPEKLKEELVSYYKNLNSDAKIRLCLYQNGRIEISHQPISDQKTDNNKTTKKIKISDVIVDSTSVFQYHKTSKREHYNLAFDEANKEGFYDVLFFNEKDQLTEASRHNIFIKKNNHYFTPPLSAGILNGTQRNLFMQQNKVTEKHLSRTELINADEILLTNAIKGVVSCRLK